MDKYGLYCSKMTNFYPYQLWANTGGVIQQNEYKFLKFTLKLLPLKDWFSQTLPKSDDNFDRFGVLGLPCMTSHRWGKTSRVSLRYSDINYNKLILAFLSKRLCRMCAKYGLTSKISGCQNQIKDESLPPESVGST